MLVKLVNMPVIMLHMHPCEGAYLVYDVGLEKDGGVATCRAAPFGPH